MRKTADDIDNMQSLEDINIRMDGAGGAVGVASATNMDMNIELKRKEPAYPMSQGYNAGFGASGAGNDGHSEPVINPEGAEKSYFQRFCPCLHPSALQPYFDVDTSDIKNRVKASLLPFNQKFY